MSDGTTRFQKRMAWLLVALLSGPAAAQQVVIEAGGNSAVHTVGRGFQRAHLIITAPDGRSFEQQQVGTGNNTFRIDTRLMSDGHYKYRMDFSVDGATRAAAPSLPSDRNGRAATVGAGVPAPAPQAGVFLLRGGQATFPKPAATLDDQDVPGKSSRTYAKDQVIADDLIVQGSGCFGFDCINNESFGFDTIRLKENNTRIKFEDTSAAGFPDSDWQLTANDSAAGGQNKFSIEDITSARVPLTVEGGAPTHSVYVDDGGRIGFGTSTPVLNLHVSSGNTPAHRLEQDGSSGFTAQTWDVAANEANFFVRDVTGGSRLPFRIRPGAPTSSIDISADGDVGIGTASPDAHLEIERAVAIAAPEGALRVTNGSHAQAIRFEVDTNGNVNARGTISQLSSRSAKEGFQEIDGDRLLAKVDALPIRTWHYLAAPDRHLGPVAEDFHQAFGLGATDKMIAPSDLAGVALAAVKALQDQVQQRDAQILALERRLAEIEARLAR